MGDLNAHNPLWGSNSISPRGRVMEDILSTNRLSLLNQKSPTFLCSSSGSFSYIDLSFCSPSISNHFKWDILDDTHGSDHYPILLRSTSPNTIIPQAPKWNFKKADWQTYSNILRPLPLEIANIDDYITQFNESILSAAKSSIRVHNHLLNKIPVPWLSQECSIAIRNHKKALNLFKRNPSTANLIDFKKKRAQAKRIIKQSKIASWQSFTSSLNSTIPSTKLWQCIKKMRGSPPRSIPCLNINNDWISDPIQISDHLAQFFQSKTLSTNSPNFDLYPSVDIESFNTSESLNYNLPFNISELTSSIQAAKHSAPGPDKIHIPMIKNLPPSYLQSLLKIYNHIWVTNDFPTLWLSSIIIPIHKIGKPRTSPNSYRPIALTSHLAKLMERMVKNRITWLLESKSLYSPHQFGFRKNRSALDHLSLFESDIRTSFNNKNHLTAISLDLKNAFDVTHKNLILSKLDNLNLKGNLPEFIFKFLQQREFVVKANGIVSNPKSLHSGIPQGSILSPLLFSIAIQPLDDLIPRHSKLRLFADDILIYKSSPITNELTNSLQTTLDSIQNWANLSGFSFSPEKSTVIHFCRKKHCPRLHSLQIQNKEIPCKNQVKILGMIFDSTLNWSHHVKYLKTKTSNDLNLLRILSHYKWGGSFPSILKIYNNLILPKLKYGDYLYDAASTSCKKPLNTIQNQALRLATGAFRTSPITSLQCISSTPPLSLSRLKSLMHFYSSAMFKQHLKLPLKLNRLNILHPHPNTIQSRIKSFLSQHNLTLDSMDHSICPLFPPWTAKPPMIDLSLSKIDKNSSPPSQIRKAFSALVSLNYRDYHHIYTDGSKSQTGVGAAVIGCNVEKKFKLPTFSSVFSAELLAIREALRIAITSKSTFKYLIITDSLSALNAIKSNNFKNSYTLDITNLIQIGFNRNIVISFLWVPSHINIKGNEKADQLAKEATLSGSRIITCSSPQDFNKHINKIAINLFQLEWDLMDGLNKLSEIKPLILPPFHIDTLSRRENIIWRRMAIGHSYLSHSHLLKGDPPPICNICSSPLTIKHLLNANHYLPLREKHHLPKSIHQILKPDPEIIKNLLKFLKEINLLDSI